VRDAEPAEEFADVLTLPATRPDDEMPVVAHHHVAKNPQRDALVGLGDDLFELKGVRVKRGQNYLRQPP
jgi:hypothetical protein